MAVLDLLLQLVPFLLFLLLLFGIWICLRNTPFRTRVVVVLVCALVLSTILPGVPAGLSPSSFLCLILGFAVGFWCGNRRRKKEKEKEGAGAICHRYRKHRLF